jgi:ABC-type antimicrobial peptide transport system ATPase subunit
MFNGSGWVPAQVFIDVPNIVTDKNVPYILDWHKLLSFIGERAIGPTTLHRANAYTIQPTNPESGIGASFLDWVRSISRSTRFPSARSRLNDQKMSTRSS